MKLKQNMYGILALIVLTILFYIDFFMQNLLNGYLFWLLLMLFAVLMIKDGKRRKRQDNNFFSKYLFLVYIIPLLIVFSLVGGESERGFSITQSGFWIILVLLIIDTVSRKEKYKKNE